MTNASENIGQALFGDCLQDGNGDNGVSLTVGNAVMVRMRPMVDSTYGECTLLQSVFDYEDYYALRRTARSIILQRACTPRTVQHGLRSHHHRFGVCNTSRISYSS